MKERQRPSMLENPPRKYPNLFLGEEYPLHFEFRKVKEPSDGQIIGVANHVGPDQYLIWDQGGVVAVSKDRYEQRKTNSTSK